MAPDDLRSDAQQKRDEADKLDSQAEDSEAKLKEADELEQQADEKRDEAEGHSPGLI